MSLLNLKQIRQLIRPLILILVAMLTSCVRQDSDVSKTTEPPENSRKPAAILVEEDRKLQEAATRALGDREGAIIVMDPQSGRIRAVANPRLAYEQSFPPGSTLKAFTAVAALRAGLIDPESRTACPGRYRRGGYDIVCSHPKSRSPFGVAQALAYSCNFYFANLAEKLSSGIFNATLASFGFGKPTGVNAPEAGGSVRDGEWNIRTAIGEGDAVLSTPIQMVAAYSALFNGGHLYRPQAVEPHQFKASETATIRVEDSHRMALIRGMRGAIEYGTASNSGLARLPIYIVGKTGTSTASNGYRRQGWFVALGAPPESAGGRDLPPEEAGLAVLVFDRRGYGSECAQVSRGIFEVYSRFSSEANRAGDVGISERTPPTSASSDAAMPSHNSMRIVRVSNVREGKIESLKLEEYVRGVLAAEASTESGAEALKAQAVATRTYALKNLGRHQGDGYDFCSLTHCELYLRIDHLSNDLQLKRIHQAIEHTAGEVLNDDRGNLADSYFSASCGGTTASFESLWGKPGPSYLRGVRDDYCVTGRHRNWIEKIPLTKLALALASDRRTDVGSRLQDVVITRRDSTGRAELITLEGDRRRQVRGWEFKIIVGRALGWNVLKSSRFEVSRRGEVFRFRGNGFGHGLGLCQQGAHVMARRGMMYRQILNHYFPGTTVGRIESARASLNDNAVVPVPVALKAASTTKLAFTTLSAESSTAATLGPAAEMGGKRITLASEHFRVIFPASLNRREAEELLRTFEAARSDMVRRLSRASLSLVQESPNTIVVHSTTQDFMAATGQPWWVAGTTRGLRTELQPLLTLRRRGILTSTIRHEYAHSVMELLGKTAAPRWLVEGFCLHIAGEGRAIKRFEPKTLLPESELEIRLERLQSSDEMRSLYATAYRHVRALIDREGEAAVWCRIANCRN